MKKIKILGDTLIEPLCRIPSGNHYGHYAVLLNASSAKEQTVQAFSEELKLPVELLIEQFSNAGLAHLSPEVLLAEQDKSLLLGYLRAEHKPLSHSQIKLTRQKILKKRVVLYENEKSPSKQ